MSESRSDKPSEDRPQERRSSGRSSSSSSRRRREVRVTSPEESMLQKHDVTRHRRRNRKPSARGIGELNLTAMIDVIFLLLIYFVITANFVKDEGVLVAKLPSGTGTEEQEKLPDLPINITLRSSGGGTQAAIEVNNRQVAAFSDLAGYLMQNQDNPAKGRTGIYAPDNPIIIHPGAGVRWAHVVNAFNATVRADYTNVSFAQATPDG